MRAFGEEDLSHILADGDRILGYLLQGVPDGLLAFIADAVFDADGHVENETVRVDAAGFARCSLGGGDWDAPEARHDVAERVVDSCAGLLRFAAMIQNDRDAPERARAVREFVRDVDRVYYEPTLDSELRETVVGAVAGMMRTAEL